MRRKGDNDDTAPMPAVPPLPPPKGDFYSGSMTEAMDRLRQSIDNLTDAINDLGQPSSGEHRKGL